ncbi:hypothetical protein I5F07_19925 [Proteus vulgaris]|jgi:hypothetical protein|uniref:hypothetical protein n=5 Tax=Enterobacterales TaxID=91347 RepID=UPI0015A9E3C3|nr:MULTISPECIES: hypothetical protein [Morganellaceae]EJD6329730.1 hypothetical protein [Proteus mirabilis]EJD6412118.1 hypothetical protein [Providencia rettgeri]MBG5987113.1 hypothetical protein [Proteus vulgaris]MBT0488966.1 hypothetical protein [Morganella morganii subsp. morganii]
MTNDDIITYLKEQKPRSTNHKVSSKDDFIDGVIAKIVFNDGNQKDIELWVIITKTHKSYAESESQLIQGINTTITKNKGQVNFWDRFFNISGLIALAIVAVVIYFAITDKNRDVPEFFKTAMLTILGFYFGGMLKGNSKNS